MRRTQRADRRGKRPNLDEKYFVDTATFKAAMAKAPKIDYERWRADMDAYVNQDPTPRPWPKP